MCGVTGIKVILDVFGICVTGSKYLKYDIFFLESGFLNFFILNFLLAIQSYRFVTYFTDLLAGLFYAIYISLLYQILHENYCLT